MERSNGQTKVLFQRAVELNRIGNRAVRAAQEENRRRGIPNAYSHNGIIYFELPNGEITQENPFLGDDAKSAGGEF